MSNEPEIGKEMSKEEKLAGISDTSQNKVQIEQIAEDSSEIININNEPSNLTVTTNITDHKHIQETLLENEKRLKAIIQGLSIAAFVVDSTHRVLYWNKALEVLSNIRAEEIIGTTNQWKAFYTQKRPCMADILIDGGLDDIEKWYAGRYKKSSLLDDSFEATDFFPNLGGDGKWLRFTATVIRNTNGDLIGVLETLEDISEPKKADEEIKREKETAQQYLDIAGSMLLVLDTTGNIGLVNKKGCEILDGTSDELTGQNWFDHFLLKEDKEKVKAVFYTLMRGEIELPVEYNDNRIVSKKGTEKWVRWHNTIIRNKDGQIIGTLSSGEDITERKKTEDALKKSEEKFVKAFKSSPVAIAITRMSDGKFVEINESLVKLFGYSHAELLAGSSIGLGLWMDNDDRKHVVEELNKNGSLYDHEYRFRTNDGKVIVARYSAEIIDFSGERCILSVLIDVTEKKRAEESLRESEEKYRSIVENTQDVIMLTNPDGQVSYMSPACVDVLGYNPNELIGKILEIFYPDDVEKVHTALSSAIQGSSGSNLEYRILTKNGTTKWVSHSWSPILTENHELQCIVSVVRDITKSKVAEQILKEKIEELEKYKNVTVNREVKMVDLKNEINELCKQLNQKPKYPNV